MALVFVGAFFVPIISNKDGIIYQKLFGEEVFECVLELWNVDTFEGGVASKSSFLEKVAIAFEKQHKGSFVLVRNMDESEFESRIAGGEMPDLFSFSHVTAKRIQPFLTELEENSEIIEVIGNSGVTSQNERLGIPWCMSGYALVSSRARIDATGNKTSNIFSGMFELGYEKKLKKSTKQIYSVVWGEKNKHNPLLAVDEEAKVKGMTFLKNGLSEHPKIRTFSPYGAYEQWAIGNSVLLLGTARDLVRMEGRMKAGKELVEEVYCLSYCTDLVQYVGVSKSSNAEKKKMAEEYSKFLCSKGIQKNLGSIGLFSVVKLDELIYDDGLLLKMENALLSLARVDGIFE